MFKRNDFDTEISGAIVHISTVLTEKRRRGTKKEEYRVRVLCIYIFFCRSFKVPRIIYPFDFYSILVFFVCFVPNECVRYCRYCCIAILVFHFENSNLALPEMIQNCLSTCLLSGFSAFELMHIHLPPHTHKHTNTHIQTSD